MNNLLTEEQLDKLVLGIININKSEYFKLQMLQDAYRMLEVKPLLNYLGTFASDVMPGFENAKVYSVAYQDGMTRYYAMDDKSGVPNLMGTYEWIPELVERA
jgi:hypothetical protein